MNFCPLSESEELRRRSQLTEVTLANRPVWEYCSGGCGIDLNISHVSVGRNQSLSSEVYI